MEQRQDRIKQALHQSPLFSSLTGLQLDRVYSHSQYLALEDQQQLFTQGEDVRYFYLVFSGKVKLYRVSPDGQEKIIEIIPAGNVFAEALVFMDKPHYPVSCAAINEAEVIGIDARDYRAILWDSNETCFSLLSAMSVRLHRLIHEIDTLTLHSGSCRVATYFLQHTEDGETSFELELAKNQIASRLSVKPETFSRIIANLKKQGVVSVDGTHVTILDREALKTISLV